MEEAERIEPDQYNVYKNDIKFYIQQFCSEEKIDDEYKMNPAQWNACLIYIYEHIFKPNPYILTIPHTVSNSYNLNAVLQICYIYIYICYSHSMEISIKGFSLLTGISRETIYSWGNGNSRNYIYKDLDGNVIDNVPINLLKEGQYVKEMTSTASDIFKKLKEENEESLTCLLKDKSINPMKILPILNHRYKWNIPGMLGDQESASRKPVLTQEELLGIEEADGPPVEF